MPPEEDQADITRRFLMNVVLPVWLAAGIADWLCHRASSIETTTGPKESLIHLLMLTEAAIPVLAGMFLEITSPVLATMIAAMPLHDATALWDLNYAVARREVKPIEQHVHDYLVMAPVMAVGFVSVLHWPQLLALLGRGSRPPGLGHPLEEQSPAMASRRGDADSTDRSRMASLSGRAVSHAQEREPVGCAKEIAPHELMAPAHHSDDRRRNLTIEVRPGTLIVFRLGLCPTSMR
jgi:hypothetical protein